MYEGEVTELTPVETENPASLFILVSVNLYTSFPIKEHQRSPSLLSQAML